MTDHRETETRETASRLPVSKLLIQPPRDKDAEDADEIRRKADAEMDLHDPQIQGDILYIEDLIGFRQEGIRPTRFALPSTCPKMPPIKAPAARKSKSEKSLLKIA